MSNFIIETKLIHISLVKIRNKIHIASNVYINKYAKIVVKTG
jgi:hypothetical protein